MNGEVFMRRAIELSRREMVAHGERAFGAVVVKNAIRAAAKRVKSNDLSECVIDTSCEPPPMCPAAISRIRPHRRMLADEAKRVLDEWQAR
jgi:tRNA(Arg) A34 adenosine deaminase TadA